MTWTAWAVMLPVANSGAKFEWQVSIQILAGGINWAAGVVLPKHAFVVPNANQLPTRDRSLCFCSTCFFFSTSVSSVSGMEEFPSWNCGPINMSLFFENQMRRPTRYWTCWWMPFKKSSFYRGNGQRHKASPFWEKKIGLCTRASYKFVSHLAE